jgi:ribosomal protein S18 acetylase RimI-like enzyme
MLYEGVFWRAHPDKPSFEEGLAYPEVKKQLARWGERAGDAAIIATIDSVPVGASWYRYWTADDPVGGFVDEATPVLAIAVHPDHRGRGIGKRLIRRVIKHASRRSIPQISLSVSKDNRALHLYRQLEFREFADRGDAFTMLRST